MAEIIRMPRMSDTMEEGVIVAWNKKVGDEVKPGDILAEVETDKATMELESYQEGTLLYIGVETGKAVPVDAILAILGEKGEDYKKILEEEKKKEPKKEEAVAEKKEPEKEKQAAPSDGKEKETKEKTVVAEKESVAKEPSQNGNGRVKASPLAKSIAKEKGIDLGKVKGTGDEGRIVKRDVETYLESAPSVSQFKKVFTAEEGYEDIGLSQMRKTIAKRLSESKFTSPHFYLTIDINMDKAVEARTSLNEILPVKISFNDLIVKTAALSLRQHPRVNASWKGDAIRQYKHIHIGVAVAVDEGLLVPVIRFADNKSLVEISTETRELAEKARAKKLQPPDWQGNTFSISNLGMFDIEEFTAIINPPDSCILAVGSIRKVPAVVDNEIKISNRMKVTLSCDHRSVDGATGARFLQTFKALMENPVKMLALANGV